MTDQALSEPLILTRHGRDRLVVLGVDHYKELLSLLTLYAPASLDLSDIHRTLKAIHEYRLEGEGEKKVKKA